MRFVVKHASSTGERVGSLTGFSKVKNAVIETPTSALFTQGGSVVHLTAEVLAKVFNSPQLLWVPLSNAMRLETGVRVQGQGIAKFAGLQDHITCATLSDASQITPSGHFEADLVPMWTKQGKKMITANRYMDLMEVFQPDIILAIADSRIRMSESRKRISKAVERSCSLLDRCVGQYSKSAHLRDSALIGVITGTGINERCESSIKHILCHREHLSGVALAGMTDGTTSTMESDEVFEATFKRVSEHIPTDLVKFVEGCWSPDIIMTAIQYGWDIFDGSYPNSLTKIGCALVLDFDVERNSSEYLLDLNDERYKEDFRPVLEGCECLSCKKYTRAYICHLLNTREMLSSVLLSIHNLHHFDQMFAHARRHIAANTFEVYKEHIINQCRETVYKPTKVENSVEIKIAQPENATKKICVSNDCNENAVTSRNIQ